MKIVVAVVVLLLVVLFITVPPIAQDLAYHQFADQNTRVGIPNFWNVWSNLPFVLVGFWGLLQLRQGKINAHASLNKVYALFFAAIILVGFGSAWYHHHPDNETLVWDRLPMTLGFMAFFSAIIAEHHDRKLGLRCLWPFLGIGMASVAYWHFSESMGHGDLRPYAVVQFLPLIAIPIMITIKPKPYDHLQWLAWFVICYVLAKVCEHFDGQIFNLLPISGHSLKHAVAALGVYFYLRYLTLRKAKL